jgi:hypothetical protein
MKDQLTAEVRVRELSDETTPEGKTCIMCGNEATVNVVVGKQY